MLGCTQELVNLGGILIVTEFSLKFPGNKRKKCLIKGNTPPIPCKTNKPISDILQQLQLGRN